MRTARESSGCLQRESWLRRQLATATYTCACRWLAKHLRRIANYLHDDGRPLIEGGNSWSDDLVAAMVCRGMAPSRAIQLAALSCERCLNVLYHDADLEDGYPEYSADWYACGTECDFCRDIPNY